MSRPVLDTLRLSCWLDDEGRTVDLGRVRHEVEPADLTAYVGLEHESDDPVRWQLTRWEEHEAARIPREQVEIPRDLAEALLDDDPDVVLACAMGPERVR